MSLLICWSRASHTLTVLLNTTTNSITTRRMTTPNNMKFPTLMHWLIYKKSINSSEKESTKKMSIITSSLMIVKTHMYKSPSNWISIINISNFCQIIRANFLHTHSKIHGPKVRISSLSKKALLWNWLLFIKIEFLPMWSTSHKWDWWNYNNSKSLYQNFRTDKRII